MSDVRIRRLRKHYRLSADSANERTRLDRILSASIEDGLLDAALERAGISATDEVCIRRIHSAVHLDAALNDARLATSWSVALADSIADELCAGGSNVVRYTSRPHALVDMACSVARGNLNRAWAWRRMGLWNASEVATPDEALAAVFDSLLQYGQSAPAVLLAVANAGVLPEFVNGVSVERWVSVARTALRAAGADAGVISAIGMTSHAQDDANDIALPVGMQPPHGTQRLRDKVQRLAESSMIFGTIAGRHTTRGRELQQAVAALALLEREPSLARETGASQIITALAGRAFTKSVANTAVPRPASIGAETCDTERIVDTRVRATTQNGGILFLLHLVRELNLPDAIANSAEFGARSLRWVLCELAHTLLTSVGEITPMRADAAILAFAGLAPIASNATTSELPITTSEQQSLFDLTKQLCTALRQRCDALESETDSVLLQRMIIRRAEIVADPAWIEARFPLSSVSTEIRRAGLDLDLGWLPWLGVVMRFVYE